MLETIKMSSKGQVVIPQDVRNEADAGEGTVFAVIGSKDTIVLKKIAVPSKEQLIRDLHTIAIEGQKRAEKLGIKESDVPELVHRFRKEKRQ